MGRDGISASSMHEAGHPKPELGNNPEELVGREVGGGSGEAHCVPVIDSGW